MSRIEMHVSYKKADGVPRVGALELDRRVLQGASSTANLTTYKAFETSLGHPLKLRRVFSGGAISTFPSSPIRPDYLAGRRVIYSGKHPAGSLRVGGVHRAAFMEFWNTVPRDMHVTYTEWHEPENNLNGTFTLGDWKNHICDMAAIIKGFNNPLWKSSIILMGMRTFQLVQKGFGGLDFWDPRFRELVDVIGFDQYTTPWNGGRSIQDCLTKRRPDDPNQVWIPMSWARERDKHVILPEWGVSDSLGDSKTQYVYQFNAWAQAQPDVDSACYFNNNIDAATNPEFSWALSGTALKAFSEITE